MSKRSESVKKWRKNTKTKLVTALGGKCQICGYDKCYDALEFHHLDPSSKEYTLSSIIVNPGLWEKIKNEASKCILLCSNCHKEVHSGVSEIPSSFQEFDQNLIPEKVTLDECPVCNTLKPITQKYCSHACSRKDVQLIDWDSIDLIKLIEIDKRTKVSIAEEIGCSDSTVGKRYKRLKLLAN